SSSQHQDSLLLLSRDLWLDGHDLRVDGPEPADKPASQQLLLPGFAPPITRPRRHRSRPMAGSPRTQLADDPLLPTYLRRLTAQGRARKGQKAYQYQMQSMLMIAERLTGRTVTCAELIQDRCLLGLVLVDETAPSLGTRVSKWTLAQRRSAIRD